MTTFSGIIDERTSKITKTKIRERQGHFCENWVTEIALHTCLTSARKSVSKIKGREKVCKEKRTRKCQNTGIFWSKTYFAPKYAKIERLCNRLHVRHLCFYRSIRSPWNRLKRPEKALFWPCKTYAFSRSKSYLEALEVLRRGPRGPISSEKYSKKALKALWFSLFRDFYL